MSWSNACDDFPYSDEEVQHRKDWKQYTEEVGWYGRSWKNPVPYSFEEWKEMKYGKNYWKKSKEDEISSKRYNQYLTTNNYSIENEITKEDLEFKFLNINNEDLNEYEKLLVYQLSHKMKIYFKKLTKDYNEIYHYINSTHASKYFKFDIKFDKLEKFTVENIRNQFNNNDLIWVNRISVVPEENKMYIVIKFKDLDPKMVNSK